MTWTWRAVALCLAVSAFSVAAPAADLNVPATVVAGNALQVPTSGSGTATLYVSGPETAIKKKVQRGQEIQLSAEDLKNAGRYVISLDGVDSATFYVVAGSVKSISFLARPSRVPSNTPGVI